MNADPLLHPLQKTLARSYSGDYVDLIKPDWRTISVHDVARALAAIRRWNGHTSRPFSVAEHSLIAADRAPRRVRLAVLLHDGHEYIIGDLVRPLPDAIDALLGGTAIRAALETIKHGLDVAIVRAFLDDARLSIADPDAEAIQIAAEMRTPAVKAADDGMGMTERRELWLHPARPGGVRLISEVEPDESLVASAWLAAVREEIHEAYGVRPMPADAKRRLGQD